MQARMRKRAFNTMKIATRSITKQGNLKAVQVVENELREIRARNLWSEGSGHNASLPTASTNRMALQKHLLASNYPLPARLWGDL